MKFSCTMRQLTGGRWRATHSSPELGDVTAEAPDRESLIEKMRGELRYRLELCPCTGESYQHIEVELVEA